MTTLKELFYEAPVTIFAMAGSRGHRHRKGLRRTLMKFISVSCPAFWAYTQRFDGVPHRSSPSSREKPSASEVR